MIYDIVCATSTASLTSIVNERLSLGWKLQGGVSIIVPGAYTVGIIKDNFSGNLLTATDIENKLMFCQAMIMEEE